MNASEYVRLGDRIGEVARDAGESFQLAMDAYADGDLDGAAQFLKECNASFRAGMRMQRRRNKWALVRREATTP